MRRPTGPGGGEQRMIIADGASLRPATARSPQNCGKWDAVILERAKGLEPSTPTLARSCSTTELHPHPRWRRRAPSTADLCQMRTVNATGRTQFNDIRLGRFH